MFWRKKKEEKKYKPLGRIGHFTKDSYPYHYTLVVERLYDVGNRSKIKLLEVDLKAGCNRDRDQCLRDCNLGEWVITNNVIWESEEQYQTRLNSPIVVNYQPRNLINDEVDYTRHPTNPFVHNFVHNFVNDDGN